MSDRTRWVLGLTLALAACGGGDNVQAPTDDEGEPPVAGCRDGSLAGGGLSRICFPEQWNGDLVLYAHGYVRPGEPLAIPDNAVAGQSIQQTVNGLGYAYATTSYRANGLVADVAVEDLVILEDSLRRTVRPDPAKVFVVGVSEGGLVTALALERERERYDGGLAACGPVGDFARQIDYFNDVRVVFDYLFPGVLPGSPVDVPEELRSGWEQTYAPRVISALAGNPLAALRLVQVTGIPGSAADPIGLGTAIVAVLWYNVFGTADAQERLGGQPYDNADRVYAGSGADAALNAGVARFTADPPARAALARFETSGDPSAPIVTIHTTGDPIVPFFHQPLYRAKVEGAGRTELLEQREVERAGHCTFTAQELLAAFAELPR